MFSPQQTLAPLNVRCENGIYYPTNSDEVKKLINFAREKGFTLRTMGAEHSPADAIVAQKNQPKQIRVRLAGDLKKIHSLEPDASGEHALVSVGAGCYLGINPKDKTSNLSNSFNYQIDQAGYALPTLGGISHQSIAGFLQTSSSGGSVQHGIADAIEEIEFINGNGELCTFKKGDKEFAAAVVSMGLLGVVTNVKFNLAKKYLVEGLEENKKVEDSFLQKDVNNQYTCLKKALFEDNEYAHINWFPQANVNRTIQWTGKAVDANLPVVPYKHPLKSTVLTWLAALVLAIGNKVDNQASGNKLAQRIKAMLLKLFTNLKEKKVFRDHWYKALPIDDQADVDGLVDTYFSELWFPKEQIDLVMQKLEKLMQDDPKAAGNFIVEFYAAKKSPFWLSPAFDRDSFRVDLYWWAKNAGNAKAYFTRFWNVLLDVPGVRLHWGKVLPDAAGKYGETVFDANFLAKAYPKLSDWLAVREKMDPQQIFVTDYWRKIFALPKPGVEYQVAYKQDVPSNSR